MEELDAFYNAILPHMDAVLEHLTGVEMSDDMDPGSATLLNLSMSLCEIAPAVEQFFEPTISYGYPMHRFTPRGSVAPDARRLDGKVALSPARPAGSARRPRGVRARGAALVIGDIQDAEGRGAGGRARRVVPALRRHRSRPRWPRSSTTPYPTRRARRHDEQRRDPRRAGANR